jgi:hypothetical protein
MRAPTPTWCERILFDAAFRKLMAQAMGLPAPWTLDLFDGEMRSLEHAEFPHVIGCTCCDPVQRVTGFADWPEDWRMPLTLVLTSEDGSIVTAQTDELRPT